jgi:UDP-N-acetylmuramate dehydrogenase
MKNTFPMIPEIKQNISLKSYNTFGIDASVRFFTEVSSITELQNILSDTRYNQLPKLILGGGSNILLLKDFEGIVIKNNIQGIDIVGEDSMSILVKVGAGVVWHEFVLWSIENNWAGIENLSLIPGTVGAAPMQNIGAYGVEIKDVFVELEALNTDTLVVEKFSLEQCQFGYRESIFKHQENKEKYVILYVTFRLQKTPIFHTNYGDIQKILADNGITTLSIKAISDAVVQIRQSKLPNPSEIGNAGSFFKNPEITEQQFIQLQKQYPQIPSYPTTVGKVKVPAGWLIEQAGWKGYREGNIGVHSRQALVLVNYGGGNGNDIKNLSQKIETSIFDKFGIQLSAEVNFI